MFCCNGESVDEYRPVATSENNPTSRTSNGPVASFQPLYKESNFPGASRQNSTDTPPADCMLIKTGGNALQAVPRQDALQDGMVAVSVPENVDPGQEILVLSPDGSGACQRVTVPEGALPGHVFLVSFPSQQQNDQIPVAVMGVPVEQDSLALSRFHETKEVVNVVSCEVANNDQVLTKTNNSNIVVGNGASEGNGQSHVARYPSTTSQNHMNHSADLPSVNSRQTQQHQHRQPDEHGRILVKVPPGVVPGDKMRVKISDGRTIEATVPAGETTQFYLKVPPKNQNWHDNPIAYGAPMVVGPFLM